MITLISDRGGLTAALKPYRLNSKKIALVPTMGNLHDGHLSLVNLAAKEADCIVVSLFVNPTQFGPNEDFARYPRTLEEDIKKLATTETTFVFVPSIEEMYPFGLDLPARVSVPYLSHILCGAFRPGHFDGVATIITILFNLVQPNIAIFGLKDYQQLTVINTLVSTLGFDIKIISAPTLREKNGLAMSSRNQYLTEKEKDTAGTIFSLLNETAQLIQSGHLNLSHETLSRHEKLRGEQLLSNGFKPDYFEVRSQNLSMPQPSDRHLVALVAAYLGKTRLIDNLSFSLQI